MTNWKLYNTLSEYRGGDWRGIKETVRGWYENSAMWTDIDQVDPTT